MDALSQFLRAAAARTFRLGEFDCGLFVADWYVAKTGKADPAKHLRGTYYEAGDLLPLMRGVVARAKLAETKEPTRGDVGIVRVGNRVMGSIFTGTRWVVLTEGGIGGVRRAEVLSAWKVA